MITLLMQYAVLGFESIEKLLLKALSLLLAVKNLKKVHLPICVIRVCIAFKDLSKSAAYILKCYLLGNVKI